MKAVCIIASDNVVIDGDVVFNKPDESGSDYSYSVDGLKKNITITNTITAHRFPWVKQIKLRTRIYLCLIWFWHTVILRKSHVYLTGVLK